MKSKLRTDRAYSFRQGDNVYFIDVENIFPVNIEVKEKVMVTSFDAPIAEFDFSDTKEILFGVKINDVVHVLPTISTGEHVSVYEPVDVKLMNRKAYRLLENVVHANPGDVLILKDYEIHFMNPESGIMFYIKEIK